MCDSALIVVSGVYVIHRGREWYMPTCRCVLPAVVYVSR